MVMVWSPASMLELSVQVAVEMPAVGSRGDRDGADLGGDPEVGVEEGGGAGRADQALGR